MVSNFLSGRKLSREINDFALSRVRFLGSGPTAPNFPWTTPRLFVLTFVSMTEHVGNRQICLDRVKNTSTSVA